MSILSDPLSNRLPTRPATLPLDAPTAGARRRRRGAVSGLVACLALLGTPAGAARAREGGGDAHDPVPTAASATYDVYVTSRADPVESVTTVREISRSVIVDEQARNLEEALRHQPSLVIRRGGEGVPRIDIRGLRTRQILFLVDGVPLRTTNDGNFDPTLVPSHVIDGIDVTYGASSVLYGDGPLAGVIQVRTRSGQEGLEVEAQGDLRDGGQVLGEASVLAGTEDVDAFVAGSYRSVDGYEMSSEFVPTSLENGRLRENADRHQGNFFLKTGYAPGERSRVDLLFDYRKLDFGVPWSTVDDPNDPYAGRTRFERMEDLEGFFLQLSGQHEFDDGFELRSWGYVTRQTERLAGYDDAGLDSMTARNSFQLDDTALITGGAVHGRKGLGRLGTLRFAANGRYEQSESMGFVNERVSGSTVAVPVDVHESYGAWSLGAEYEVAPVERSALVVGYSHAFLEAADPVATNGPIFLAGGHYDFETETRVRFAAARKLRFPSIRQLFDPGSGNPALQPETCWCYELGLEQSLPWDSRLTVVGYWMDLENFIERLSSGAPFENRQTLRNRGVEIGASSRPLAGLFMRVDYTFLDAVDTSAGSAFAGPLPNRPRHKIDSVVQYTFPTETTLRAALTWADGIIEYTRNPPLVAMELADPLVLDLVIEQRLWSDRLRVYVGVDNVTDDLWTYNYGFPQPGRTVYGGIEVRAP